MITWTLPGFVRLTREQVVRGFTKAGVWFVSFLRGRLNRDQAYERYSGGTRYRGLDPSKPGEYPKKLSGQLIKSMTWEVNRERLTLTVGSNLKGYPAFLERGTPLMARRPWLSMGFDQGKGTIGKLVMRP